MMKEEENKQNEHGRRQRAAREPSDTAKKPYVRPLLTCYGDVHVITQGADMGNSDGNQTGNSLTGSV